MKPLDIITQLSHEFGVPYYVKGGGGNSSVKDAETLWIKPSGTTLATIKPEQFVAMDRGKIAELYNAVPPQEANDREEMVKDLMMAAVRPDSKGRPSVEAPLHDSFLATYVVHTHPALVNGLTCSRQAETACRRLFPEALWEAYIDPGYTLCMRLRKVVQDYIKRHGHEQNALILRNHGIFVTANTPEGIRQTYHHVMSVLEAEYKKAGIALGLKMGPEPNAKTVDAMKALLRKSMGEKDAAHVRAVGTFSGAEDAISPDHIVYSKSRFLFGDPTPETVEAFVQCNGYKPRVVITPTGAYGVGPTQNHAHLALEMALDGAQIMQLAQAFGGIEYMTDRARRFIEEWEVESYRSKVMEEQHKQA